MAVALKQQIGVDMLHGTLWDKILRYALPLAAVGSNAPIILLFNFLAAIFRSQGDARTPLHALVLSGILNVVLNLFFVLVLGWTVDGVATATVLANGVIWRSTR